MKLSGLKIVVAKIDELTLEEKNFLISIYHKLFINIYGNDLVDAFAYVTKTNVEKLVNEDYKVKFLSKNYKQAKEVVGSLENNANSKLLLIYIEDNLIGSALVNRIDDITSSVPYIVIDASEKDIEREIWKRTVSFVEKYLTDLGYKKMYLEIPLKEGPLLIRAKELGFKEDPEDIVMTEEVYTYVFNKNIEGNINVK